MRVSFSAIPVNEEFIWKDKKYKKTNHFGIAKMICNAESVDEQEPLCINNS